MQIYRYSFIVALKKIVCNSQIVPVLFDLGISFEQFRATFRQQKVSNSKFAF
jgi:hypothetical protein